MVEAPVSVRSKAEGAEEVISQLLLETRAAAQLFYYYY